MAKKLGITLPDAIWEELEDIATRQGRPPTTLASFLIEYCLASQLGIAGYIHGDDAANESAITSGVIIGKLLGGQVLSDGELNSLITRNLALKAKKVDD